MLIFIQFWLQCHVVWSDVYWWMLCGEVYEMMCVDMRCLYASGAA